MKRNLTKQAFSKLLEFTLERDLAKRAISLLLVLALLCGIFPTAYAAEYGGQAGEISPAVAPSDIPEAMLENFVLDSLKHTGYDVYAQVEDGTIYKDIGGTTAYNYGARIQYVEGLTGREMVDDSDTRTGKAPNIARFKSVGLVCAGYITYYYLNYLPNMVNGDYDDFVDAAVAFHERTLYSYQAVEFWQRFMAQQAGRADSGVREIYKSSDLENQMPSSVYTKMAIGDLILFGNTENVHVHAGIYLGAYNGQHFIAHMTYGYGPCIGTVEGRAYVAPDDPKPATYVYAVYRVKGEHRNPYGALDIQKSTSDGQNIEGWQFGIYADEGCRELVSGPHTMNSTGMITVDKLQKGFYYVKELGHTDPEIEALYACTSENPQRVEVVAGETAHATVSFVNMRYGSLTVTKTAEDGIVSGVRFHLYGTALSGKNVDMYATTDSTGKAEFKNLPAGSGYVLEEVGTPDRYVVPANQTVEINWNEVTSKSFHNQLERGSLKIEKTTSDGKNLAGWQFGVYSDADCKTLVSGPYTTGSTGKLTVENLLPDTYYVKELGNTDPTIEAQYECTSANPQKVVVVAGETATYATVSFVNMRYGSLTVTKTAEDGLVSGIRFHLYGKATNGKAVDMYATTDSTGKAEFKNIPNGTAYTLEEVDTPNRYVVPEKQTVAIEWNKVTNKTFENKLQRGGLKIEKVTTDGKNLAGWRFGVYSDADCTKLVSGPFTTGSTGKITVGNLLPDTYYVKELGHTDPKIEALYGCDSTNPQKVVVVAGKEDAYATVFFENSPHTGSLTVTKTAEDGLVSGVQFHLSGTSGLGDKVDMYATTDSTGKAYFTKVPVGTGYVLEEVGTPNRYVVPDKQTADIEWNKVTNKTFENKLKRGDLTVTKTAEDGLAQGMRFHLYGTSLCGQKVDEYATVGSDGNAYFKDILIGTGYTLEEVNTPNRYVIPEKLDVTIKWNEVTKKTVENRLKKWNLTVTKRDSETGTAQGDASLAGAVYGIYKGEALIDSYTTDANGQFTTRYYDCGDDWSLREITPGEGYLLDETVYHIGAEAGSYTVEYNKLSKTVAEGIIHGKIAIIKHTDDGETHLETPEVGAEFEVYLKSAGSYAAAKDTERDYLVCDENGFAETKLLPYGIFTVHQVKGWDGRALLPDFDVFVSEDGHTYRFLANNKNFRSYIKVVKVDAETGKAIPYAGAGFRLYRPDGSLITQTFTYPTLTTIDTFYTNDEGYLITPEPLEYGIGYSLVEVSAPYGYVLDSDPVYFDVTEDNTDEDGALIIVKVVKEDMPQKGIISITKTGEVFATVVESDGVYQPVYAVQGLPGAVYEITAAEDIYTPDGTLRYAKGTVLDIVTTDETGNAQSKPLYLGRYEVKETTAPHGMVLNGEIHSVELTYAGQEIEITETASGFYNERQKVEISLDKVMESDEQFGIGMNGEITAVTFGLYAAEDLIAADGTVIPADGLLEVVSAGENGHAVFETDLPFGSFYLQEIATDSHYILSDTKYPVVFAYAGQEVATVYITANDSEAIRNGLIYSTVKGLKIDRETGAAIAGAVFGLFRSEETAFTKETAILIAESNSDGVFTFEKVPYGDWLIVEMAPAEGFLPNTEIYRVKVTANEEIVEITAVNDRIPEIGTTATTEDGKQTHNYETIIIEDVVAYQHLIPGKAYTVKGVLMDKATGEPFLVNGEQIVSEATFVPEQPFGEIVVTFIFDGTGITENTDLVAFERLYKDGIELAVHADIADEGQTVTVLVPEIGTTATTEDGKETHNYETISIEDVVKYENLIPGREYTVKGILMDKATGEPFLVNGEQVVSEVTFIPEQPSGEVVVTFVFDGKGITENTDLVVFESLYKDGIELTVHSDIEDDSQTVTVLVPEIGTTAITEDGKQTHAYDTISIEDVVKYENLIPGKEYTVKGILMDKATGKPFLVNGEQVVSEVTFVAEKPSDEVVVTFVFDGTGITENTDLVVFESLYKDGTELAVHADIEDEGQTVTVFVPEIGTTATTEDGKRTNPSKTVTIRDTVKYKDLIPGKEYTLKGTLMDKATGEPFLVNGEQVVSKVTFVAERPSGEVVVTFVFDGTGITENTDLVAFESLYKDGIELTAHADIEDDSQTVTVLVPKIGTTASVDGKKEVPAQGEITITDVVSYKDLIPGNAYILYGVLMDKATGKPLVIDGAEFRCEVRFTPEAAEGEVSAFFTLDASRITKDTDIVVFEAVIREDEVIAVHADLTDEGQTVTIHHNPGTGDVSLLPVFISGSVSLVGLIASAIVFYSPKGKRKKASKAED